MGENILAEGKEYSLSIHSRGAEISWDTGRNKFAVPVSLQLSYK